MWIHDHPCKCKIKLIWFSLLKLILKLGDEISDILMASFSGFEEI
jgi:hypothetical protein